MARYNIGHTAKPAPRCGIRSLHAPGRIGGGRRRRRYHQAQTLQQHYRALCRCSPDKLATFSLTVLDINISTRVFQTAILELTVYVNAIVQNNVLTLENLVLVPIHNLTRPT